MIEFKESPLKVRGDWTIKYVKNGVPLWEHTQKNLITNSGLLILAKLVISDFANAQIYTIGYGDGTGTGTDAPVESDVILKSDNWFKKDLDLDDAITSGANQARIYWEVIFNDDIDVVNGAITYSGGFPTGDPFTIKEFGIFSINDDMFNRIAWTGPDLVMDSDIKLEGYFTFTVNAV